jgi:uncharacterized protein YecT (DUF1311 family)
MPNRLGYVHRPYGSDVSDRCDTIIRHKKEVETSMQLLSWMIASGLLLSSETYAQTFPSQKEASDVMTECLSHAGQEPCLSAYATNLDAQLQQVYARVDTNVQGLQGKSDKSIVTEFLSKSQVAWADFRNARCAFEGRLFGLGVPGRIIYIQCRILMTIERGQYLKRVSRKKGAGLTMMIAPAS